MGLDQGKVKSQEFERATEIFGDPNLISRIDRIENGDYVEYVRIISARKADRKGGFMPTVLFKPEERKPMTKEEKLRLESIRDEDIDYSDIPPSNPEEWKDAVRGKFYRPRKESISLRIDSDVLHRFRS